MNLLNNIFNTEDIEIVSMNKKYIIFTLLVLVFIIGLLMIKKNNFYINSFSVIDEEIIILVEKDYVNEIKNSKEIIINDINSKYSINTITLVNDNFLISINLDTKIKNISDGKYKVYLGKERIFDYIIRVIKK